MPVKKNIFKTIFSYFTPITIEQAASDYNPELDVILTQGRYQLISRKAIYSFEDKYDNFKKSFDMIDWHKFHPKNIFVLGLGLGSVIQLLELNFGQKAHFTAVEIDESVIYLAEKYILGKLSSPIEIICADALNFVQMHESKYDLIIMDVFRDDQIPIDFQSMEFLKELKKNLNPNGLLLYNCLASTKTDQLESKSYYDNIFKKMFANAYLADVHENYMLFNTTNQLKNH